MNTTQRQYIAQWHDSFVNYIRELLSFIEFLVYLPQVTDEDKRTFDKIKTLLHSKEAKEIEQSLAMGIVKQDTLNKIEKLDKDLIDYAVDHMTAAPLAKEFLKKLTYCQIEKNKKDAISKLHELLIPIN